MHKLTDKLLKLIYVSQSKYQASYQTFLMVVIGTITLIFTQLKKIKMAS